jgi:hypothetical protein
MVKEPHTKPETPTLANRKRERQMMSEGVNVMLSQIENEV